MISVSAEGTHPDINGNRAYRGLRDARERAQGIVEREARQPVLPDTSRDKLLSTAKEVSKIMDVKKDESDLDDFIRQVNDALDA